MRKSHLVIVACLLTVAAVFVGAYSSRRSSSKVSQSASTLIEHAAGVSWSMNERSIPSLQDRLKREPDNPDLNSALGHAYLQKARETGDSAFYGKAETLFDRALRSQSDHVDALIGKGSLALSRHQFRQAKDVASQAVKLAPQSPAAFGVLADALIEMGEYPSAVGTLDRMVALKPSLASYSRISYARELHGDTEGAIMAMEMAIRAGSPNSENTAWCIVQLGNLYLNSSRVSQAVTAYEGALRQFPGYAHAYAGLAKAHVARKDFTTAAELYRKAIERLPLPEFLIGLGEVDLRLGKVSEARSQFELVSALQELFRSNGVSVDAEVALFEADRGIQSQEAVASARKAYREHPSVKSADVLGWTLYKSGQRKEAREMIIEALRLGSREPIILYHAGMIAYASQDSRAARDYLARAIMLNPGFSALYAPEAETVLARMSSDVSH